MLKIDRDPGCREGAKKEISTPGARTGEEGKKQHQWLQKISRLQEWGADLRLLVRFMVKSV